MLDNLYSIFSNDLTTKYTDFYLRSGPISILKPLHLLSGLCHLFRELWIIHICLKGPPYFSVVLYFMLVDQLTSNLGIPHIIIPLNSIIRTIGLFNSPNIFSPFLGMK